MRCEDTQAVINAMFGAAGVGAIVSDAKLKQDKKGKA
jgi:hypothetical protein